MQLVVHSPTAKQDLLDTKLPTPSRHHCLPAARTLQVVCNMNHHHHHHCLPSSQADPRRRRRPQHIHDTRSLQPHHHPPGPPLICHTETTAPAPRAGQASTCVRPLELHNGSRDQKRCLYTLVTRPTANLPTAGGLFWPILGAPGAVSAARLVGGCGQCTVGMRLLPCARSG